MTQYQNNILEYIICCVGAFAEHFSITNAQAYRYLSNYKALAFLLENYDVEHTQSIEDAVEDCARICQRHGGALAL